MIFCMLRIFILLSFIFLLDVMPDYRIYYGTLAYTSVLKDVVKNRKWDGVDERFDILLATENCNDLAKWTWVISNGKVYQGVIVDCAKPEHRQQMLDNFIVADVNLAELNGQEAWVIVR